MKPRIWRRYGSTESQDCEAGVLECVSGSSLTFQNNSLGWVALMADRAREHGVLPSAQATRAKAPWSCITLNPAIKIKWDYYRDVGLWKVIFRGPVTRRSCYRSCDALI
jgi:hypothetical protein